MKVPESNYIGGVGEIEPWITYPIVIIVFNTDTTAVRLPDNTTTIKLTLIS